MTWTKLDDGFPDEFLELSDAAFRLHVATTCYANRVGLDGQISKARLQLVPVPPTTRRKPVIDELLKAGRWAVTDEGWMLVDFFAAQPTAVEAQLQRHWNVQRQQIRWAKTPEKRAEYEREAKATHDALKAAREQRKDLNSQRTSLVNSHVPVPYPSRPVPPRSEDEGEDDARPFALSGAGPASSESERAIRRAWAVEAADRNVCISCFEPVAMADLMFLIWEGGLTVPAHQTCFDEARHDAA